MQTGTPVQAEWVLDSIQNPACIDNRIVEVMHAYMDVEPQLTPDYARLLMVRLPHYQQVTTTCLCIETML